MSTIINATTTNGVVIQPDNSGSLVLQTNSGTTALTIDTSQNVGIGTASPAYKLDITAGAPLRVVGTAGNAAGFEVCGNGSTYGTTSLFVGQGGTGIGFLYQRSNEALAFGTNNIERMRITSGGLLQFNSGYGSVATAYGCRAWVNFNGTGTPAIRGSGNVSSITDNGTGDYTVNFTTAMPDANYTTTGTGNFSAGTAWVSAPYSVTPTTSAVRVGVVNIGVLADLTYVNVAIFR